MFTKKQITGAHEIAACLDRLDPLGAWDSVNLMNHAADERVGLPATRDREKALLVADERSLKKWIVMYRARKLDEACAVCWPGLQGPEREDEEVPKLRGKAKIIGYVENVCPTAAQAVLDAAGAKGCPVHTDGAAWETSPRELRPWLKTQALLALKEVAKTYDPTRHRAPPCRERERPVLAELRRELAAQQAGG